MTLVQPERALPAYRKLIREGARTEAVVIGRKKINESPAFPLLYDLELTLRVEFKGGTTAEIVRQEEHHDVLDADVGARLPVRYDAGDRSRVEIDLPGLLELRDSILAEQQEAEALAAQEAKLAQTVPPELVDGVLGRGALLEVLSDDPPTNGSDALVECVITVGVRLVDGTPKYTARCRQSLPASTAEALGSNTGILVTVRADPDDPAHVALSLTDPIPVVDLAEDEVDERAAAILRDGVPARALIIASQRQFLRNPGGDEFYAVALSVTGGEGPPTDVHAFVPVPDEALDLLESGLELPAKRLAADPGVVTIDWDAALSEQR